MKLGIAADHRGYKQKENLKKYLNKKNIEFVDFGTNSLEIVDYPEYALKVCREISKKNIDLGILICGTGIGMSIVANKYKGIMCAKVDTSEEAELAVKHNHVNVISLSSNLYFFQVKDIIDSFLKSKPINEDKYNRRIEIIKKIENRKIK